MLRKKGKKKIKKEGIKTKERVGSYQY